MYTFLLQSSHWGSQCVDCQKHWMEHHQLWNGSTFLQTGTFSSTCLFSCLVCWQKVVPSITKIYVWTIFVHRVTMDLFIYHPKIHVFLLTVMHINQSWAWGQFTILFFCYVTFFCASSPDPTMSLNFSILTLFMTSSFLCHTFQHLLISRSIFAYVWL